MSAFEKNDDFLSLQDPKKQGVEETSSSKKKNRKRRRVSESDSNSNDKNDDTKEEGEETSTITKDGKAITTITTTMTKGRRRNDPRGKKGKTRKEREEEAEAINISPEELKKYERGTPLPLDGIKDKKLKGKLSKVQKLNKSAAQKAAMAEILITTEPGFIETEGMEKSFKVKQSDVKASVDVQSAKKSFDLTLDTFGPYTASFTRNGKHLLLGGHKGHLALIEWNRSKMVTEFHVKESVRDVKFLQNHNMFAVAQKKYVYIYDNKGLELHCLKQHVAPTRLEFLPYHYLLVSASKTDHIRYQDTSTGSIVADHRTKLGPCDVMAQNPWNAVILLGHNNGSVTMWSPNMTTPLVKMLTHRGPVRAVTVDRSGTYMTSSGVDGSIKIWDIRNYKELHSYSSPTPASTLSLSQTGLLSVGWGPHIEVWKDALVSKQPKPYMKHLIEGSVVQNISFCPYEDVLGVGHLRGYTSLLIPGAGQASFDSFEVNPYETKKQRTEGVVRSLLEKLQPDMIVLDPTEIGSLDTASKDVLEKEKEVKPERKKRKKDTPGRNINRSLQNKQKNILDEKRVKLQEEITKQKEEREKAKKDRERGVSAIPQSKALARFAKKKV